MTPAWLDRVLAWWRCRKVPARGITTTRTAATALWLGDELLAVTVRHPAGWVGLTGAATGVRHTEFAAFMAVMAAVRGGHEHELEEGDCARCANGALVSDTCDACDERHCTACDPCDDDEGADCAPRRRQP